ncbi:MAG TPA: O-antigen ligase family protein [Bacteroidales bacterium]|nr:O-antigen ligase family protein [Bacteroidales bacterium]HPS16380.1 O-antigen ligase family protein [Bacteroidales bacterium]
MILAADKWDISKIHVFLTCLLISLIPFAVIMISYAIMLWLVSALVLIFFYEKKRITFKFNFAVIINLLLYLVFVVGVFYSENIPSALFDIQLKLSLILFPPIIYLLRNFYKRYFNFVLLAFVIANIFAGFYCLGNAFLNSVSFENSEWMFNSHIPGVYADTNTDAPSYFTYSNLSLFKHPSYFSMYLILCVFIMVYFVNNSLVIIKNQRTSNIIYATATTFLIIMIYLLKSKAAYGTLILFSVIYFIVYAIMNKKKFIGAIVVVALIILGIIGYKQNSRFYYVSSLVKNQGELVDAIQKKEYQFIIDRFGVDRIPIWMLSVEIINEHFLFGVGSGDVSDNLMSKYKKYELHSLVENKYNTHNQYLETFIAVGVIGFLIFMTWLFYPFFLRRNYTRKRFLILIFIGIIIINFMFEAVLNTIAGVIFIAFFYSFLLFVKGRSQGTEKTLL